MYGPTHEPCDHTRGGLLDINDRENFTYSQTIREVCLNYEFACQRVSHNEFRLVFIPFDEINVFFLIHGIFFNSNVRKCKNIIKLGISAPRRVSNL